MFSKLESFRGIIFLGDLLASFSSLLLDIARAGWVDTPQKKTSELQKQPIHVWEEEFDADACGSVF